MEFLQIVLLTQCRVAIEGRSVVDLLLDIIAAHTCHLSIIWAFPLCVQETVRITAALDRGARILVVN